MMGQLAESAAVAEALVCDLLGASAKPFEDVWRDMHSGAVASDEQRELFALACLKKSAQLSTPQGMVAKIHAYLDLGLWLGGPDSVCAPFINSAINLVAAPSLTAEPARVENTTLLPGLDNHRSSPEHGHIVDEPPSPPARPSVWTFTPPIHWSTRQFWERYAHRYVSVECAADGSVQRWVSVRDFLTLLASDDGPAEHHCNGYLDASQRYGSNLDDSDQDVSASLSWWFANGRIFASQPTGFAPSLPYLAQAPLLDLWPALSDDIVPQLPQWLTVTHKATLAPLFFFGPKGVWTAVHTDPTSNAFYQCAGLKLALLWAPDALDQWRDASGDPQRAHFIDPSIGDVTDISLAQRFPTFPAPHMQVVLRPGQCLFIPQGWWHFFKAETTSISVSFMF
eukprot:GEMP01044305.1.p1 GENE.GEMP01044305.1~~GEMP01044305.1.p1  ORF type:complete len:411 (+),score=82.25 GEMP01044305.1:48-1235(+)